MKVAGGVGTFDELLAKARLEEAKLRDLLTTRQVKSSPVIQSSGVMDSEIVRGSAVWRNIQCNNCRAYGHIARFCPKRGRGDTKEATGNSPAQGHSRVSVLVPDAQESIKDEVENAIEQVMFC